MNINVGYVSLKLSLKDGMYFADLLSNVVTTGRMLKPHEMHMTLMYDQENPIPANAISKVSEPDKIYTATVVGIGLLGEDDSAYRAVVLNLESPEIDQRFSELSIFMNHSFDGLKQHVSLLYGATDGDLELVKNALTGVVGSTIILYGESFATIKED